MGQREKKTMGGKGGVTTGTRVMVDGKGEGGPQSKPGTIL